MARLARLAVPGYPHLVAHHAGTRDVIRDDADARRLIDELHGALAAAGVALHGFALMARGLWLLATPADARGLGYAMQSIGRRYVRWVNDRRGERGGLFAGRYRAAVLDPATASLSALVYVESLPARLAVAPEQYAWSSCRVHIGLATDPYLSTLPAYWALGNTPFERQAAYGRLLDAGTERGTQERLEKALAGGWVVGSAAFIGQIQPLCTRRPQLSRAGRPRRALAVATQG
ncbi:MAG TPA: transposase [Burkholderiaceae bacterium]|nr:transposase [Burkholderiaceae bacterium]